MTTSPLFKRAFVRGMNTELIREGVVVYPSKEAADASADYIADNAGMPDPYSQGQALDVKVAGELVELLIKAAEFQCERAGQRYNPAVTKTAQETTAVSLANDAAWELMEKAAADTGALVEGGKAPNTEPDAAKDNAEAALDIKRRPMGYAHLGEKGVGNYEKPSEGTVGDTSKHPEAPGATGHDTNSLTEKGASLTDIVRRVSGAKTASTGTGSLILGGDAPNTLAAAASTNNMAALEQKNRPQGYAHMGESRVGQTDFNIPSGAVIGREQPHPGKPGATGSGSNTIIAQTKNAFDQLFEQTATQVVPYLPEQMPDETKIAHVRSMMGLQTEERANYLENLYSTLGVEKTAAANVSDHFKKSAAACEHKEPDGDEGTQVVIVPPAMAAKKDEKPAEKTAAEQPAQSSTLSGLRARVANLSA